MVVSLVATAERISGARYGALSVFTFSADEAVETLRPSEKETCTLNCVLLAISENVKSPLSNVTLPPQAKAAVPCWFSMSSTV